MPDKASVDTDTDLVIYIHILSKTVRLFSIGHLNSGWVAESFAIFVFRILNVYFCLIFEKIEEHELMT